MEYLEGMIELISKAEPKMNLVSYIRTSGQSFLIGVQYDNQPAVLKIPLINGEYPYEDNLNFISLENELGFYSMLNNISNISIPKRYSSNHIKAEKVSVPYLILKKYSRTLDSIADSLDTEQLFSYTNTLFQTVLGLHNQGIVHRDINTTNCLIDDSVDDCCALVISDFGIARKYNPSDIYSDRIGTFGMISPEQEKGICVPAIDVWQASTVYLGLLMGMNLDALYTKEKEICNLKYEFTHGIEGYNTLKYEGIVSSRFGKDIAKKSIPLFERAFVSKCQKRADIEEVIDLFEKIRISTVF